MLELTFGAFHAFDKMCIYVYIMSIYLLAEIFPMLGSGE